MASFNERRYVPIVSYTMQFRGCHISSYCDLCLSFFCSEATPGQCMITPSHQDACAVFFKKKKKIKLLLGSFFLFFKFK